MRSFKKNTRRKEARVLRDSKGGGTGFLVIFMFFFFILGTFMAFLAVTKSQHRMAWSHRDEALALAMADSAMDQTLSMVRTGQITVPLEFPPAGTPTPSGMPTEVAIPVSAGSKTVTAYAKIDYARDSSNNILRDIEGNLTFKAVAVAENTQAVGSGTKLKIRRGVQCDFTVVNFGRYLGYIWGDDQKAFGSQGEFNGPYHANGNLTFTGGSVDWNDSTLKFQSNAVNTFYDPTYTTIVAGTISGISSNVYSQNRNLCTNTGGGFNILTNASSPNGTWIDGANGGFVVNPPTVPSNVSSLAQVVIDPTLMLNSNVYTLQGTGITNGGSITLSSCPMFDAGVAGYTSSNLFVPINLSALASGWTDTSQANGDLTDFQNNTCYMGPDDTTATANYTAALNSTYGLVIYVNGNVAVWGMLPPATGGANTNKKVTIIATGSMVEMCGDILYSSSPYYSGVESSSEDINVDPLVDNPNNDSIAIVAPNANIFVDTFYRGNPSYVVNSSTASCGGDMRFDAFLYTASGYTGGNYNATAGSCPGGTCGRQTYTSTSCGINGGCTSVHHFTYHGALSVMGSGFLPVCSYYSRMFDPNIKYNLSSIIPSATVFHAYQDMVNPPILP